MKTTMMPTPSLNDLVKEAMEGAARKVDFAAEAARQMANIGEGHREESKTASAKPLEITPNEYIQKLAAGLEYLEKEAEAASTGTGSLGPGRGPHALAVLTPKASGTMPDAGEQGHARKTIPLTPAMASSGVAKDPPNAMASSAAKTASSQAAVFAALGIKVAAKEKCSECSKDPCECSSEKKAAALAKKNLEVLSKTAGFAVAAKAPVSDASDDLFLAYKAHMAEAVKQAEDAINPAHISAGKVAGGSPEGVSASEENVPKQPAGATGLVASNQAAINYTRRDAKAPEKSQMNPRLNEPMMSTSTDSTLQKTLAHTNEAGAKIAGDLTRTAAAQALLSKFAEDARAAAAKKKTANMPGSNDLSTASGQSGFQANNVGGM